jgi:hypothetical protein
MCRSLRRVVSVVGPWLIPVLAACADGSAPRPGATPRAPAPDADPAIIPAGSSGASGGSEAAAPWLTLPLGSRYFERDGRRAPVLLRNVSAANPADFAALFRDARAAGTTVVRLQLTQGFGYDTLGIESSGAVLSTWASAWEAVLDEAARQGLSVIPVFAIWGDWNDGSPALGWSHFDANPLGRARGGAADSPSELFSDTPTQRRWLGWLEALVERWGTRPNVAAWEIFSELDLATGATETSATDFVERAHAVIQAADLWQRPAFASTSDLPLLSGQPWQRLWRSAGNDIVAIHPYDSDLDRAAVERVQSAWSQSDKPVLLGESGLDSAPPDGLTLTSALRAPVALRNAIWAELVSGAASARALYWEDGYSAYFPGSGLPLVTARQDLEREPAHWLAEKEFRYLAPLPLSGEPLLFGAAMGTFGRVLGWARNGRLAPPGWDAPPLERMQVRVALPPDAPPAATWFVTLTAPDDGSQTTVNGSSDGGLLSFEVEGPVDSVAFDAVLSLLR